jgi:phosphoglycolate phosphatase-like HAD superfamily hydrolase
MTSQILAFDFDGVICNGLIEYFQTAWRTYCKIWSPAETAPPDRLAERFYHLRPVIETGWEMPILIKAQLQGIAEVDLFQNWSKIADTIVQQDKLRAPEIGKLLDELRDEWIASDLEGWLSLHQFYPGVVETLQSLSDLQILPIIITTKEGRFVRSLLGQQGIELSDAQLYGKEYGKPKHQVLREILERDRPSAIAFIEDRLKTLQVIQKYSDLNTVQLYLADWGYNTQSEHEAAAENPTIQVISLSQLDPQSLLSPSIQPSAK